MPTDRLVQSSTSGGLPGPAVVDPELRVKPRLRGVNFLADPAQRLHLRTDELADLIGVKQTTMANKGR